VQHQQEGKGLHGVVHSQVHVGKSSHGTQKAGGALGTEARHTKAFALTVAALSLGRWHLEAYHLAHKDWGGVAVAAASHETG